jgi:hypothetical protein
MSQELQMNDTTTPTLDIARMRRVVAESMPEFGALQKRLLAETPNVRRAVATALSDWASSPILDMTPAEADAYLARLKAELARREAAERPASP